MTLLSFDRPSPIHTLLVTGQSSQYHDWRVSSASIRRHLAAPGLFDVTTVRSPGPGEEMSCFVPAFAEFDLVVIDYEGDEWPAEAKDALVGRIAAGGGLVIYHATSNAFPSWSEFQELCGVGGWGGRDESSGPK